MVAMAHDVLGRFEEYVMERRSERLDELAERTAERYAPFGEKHPMAKQFASLLEAEEQHYCAEACVTMVASENVSQLIYLREQREKLHDLFLKQLRLCGDQCLADDLEPELQNERVAIEAARAEFVTFSFGIMALVNQMDHADAQARDEDDEATVRRLAALIMRNVRLERGRTKLFVP